MIMMKIASYRLLCARSSRSRYVKYSFTMGPSTCAAAHSFPVMFLAYVCMHVCVCVCVSCLNISLLYLNADPALCRCLMEPGVSSVCSLIRHTVPSCETGGVGVGRGVIGDTGGPEAVRYPCNSWG